ncbi:MAG: NlpC/P60 family protein [Nocardioides sp.]
MTVRRTRITTAIAALSLAALGSPLLASTPTFADPSIDTVQAQVDQLYRQAEQASERYDAAREQVRRSQVRLRALQTDLRREQAKTEAVRRQVAAAVVAQSQGQNLSTAKMFLSSNPDAFLEQMTTVAQYDDQQHQMMSTYAVQAKQLQMRQQVARHALAEVTSTERKMAADKATIDHKAGKAKALLAQLKSAAAAKAAAAARAPQPSRSASSPVAPAPVAAPSVPASGRAGAAVSYAMAQVGKAYVYGAAGPNAFDCSGLTMMAWGAAGVSLPHSAAAQMSSGTPVSESQLQPGDLVFYYSPVSHVGMYIGGGKIVNAENPSVGVAIAPLHMMPYAGAVRPG